MKDLDGDFWTFAPKVYTCTFWPKRWKHECGAKAAYVRCQIRPIGRVKDAVYLHLDGTSLCEKHFRYAKSRPK